MMSDSEESLMSRYIAALPAVLRGKKRMVEKKITRARAKCPLCQAEASLNLGLAPNHRDPSGFHLRWHCQCGFQGME